MLIALLIAAPFFLVGWGLCLSNYIEERRQREFDQDLARSIERQ